MFKPANVFPEPGTPVMKHIDFCLFFFALEIILSIAAAVLDIFCAPASLRVISKILCEEYND